jgi:Na+/proline symporter
MNDFYLPRCAQPPSAERQLLLGRMLSVLFGMAQIVVGIAAQYRSQRVIDEAMSIAGFTTGVILGVFFLGIFPVRATSRGAYVGLVAGLAVMTWVAFGTALAWPWYTITGSATTFFAGSVASCLLPEPVAEPLCEEP